MLDINVDTIRFIIDKAREFQAKEAVSIPEEPLSPAEDWALQILADHAEDPAYQEVASVIDDLGPDQRVALEAEGGHRRAHAGR